VTWPSDTVVRPRGRPWDLLVVGGGTAGIVAARTAARLGATVLLVEQDRTGGDCLWTGCVPSKALLAAAHTAANARAAHRHGIQVGRVEVDFPAVMAGVRAAIAAVAPVDSPDRLRQDGVRVARGRVRFGAGGTATVGEHTVAFSRAVLACGAEPVMPDAAGLSDAEPLTTETVWSLTSLPSRLLVVGGGSVGCELGQAFARLGSHVTIVEAGPRLLPREDTGAADLVHAALVADGVDVRADVSLGQVTVVGADRRATTSDGAEIGFDAVLVAVGRRPRIADLGLTEAGVAVDADGFVRVDTRLRTASPRIWAAGDVTGQPQFTHTAGVDGSIAAGNAVLGLRRTVDRAMVPRVTFTQPEVASFGVGVAAARRDGLTVRTVSHRDVDRAAAEDLTDGFSRLVLDRRGRVVGATVVGPRAGESLPEPMLAARRRLRARDIAAATHAYPTYGDGLWTASIDQVQAGLRRVPARWVIRGLAAVQRRRSVG
jgi:pyruvate/2-oxoglutarate dehydrogenase complex dihydrolipoamide dehydrogenase (E3) component